MLKTLVATCTAALSLAALALSGCVTYDVAPTPEALATGGAVDLDAALARARSEERLVFAVATADWCVPCQDYKRGALTDPRVARWLGENAVPVVLDVTEGASEQARALGVGAIPATFLLDAEGTVLAKGTGLWSADELLAWLDAHAG